jgi:hypothetical protein
MVQTIPDQRWRLCVQLIAAYGLRPEEIQHLEPRQGPPLVLLCKGLGAWQDQAPAPAIAAMRPMGRGVQTHLAAYCRWCGDDVVDDAFARAEQRLADGQRAQISAA